MVRIEPFLLEDELLVGSCGTGRGLVCVSDRRLLRVEHSRLGRMIRDLSYREISSVVIADAVSWPAIGSGLVLGVAGALLPSVAPAMLVALGTARPMRLTFEGTQLLLLASIVLMVLGVALILMGLLRRPCYVSLEGPFMLRDRRHRAAWRFAAPTPSDARVFARMVRERLDAAPGVGEKKVLPHDSV